MVPQRDDRRHEGLLGRPPSADQGIGEDDPFEIVDGEEAAAHVRHEFAAVLADLRHERAAGTKVHLHDLASGRRRNPPLREARGIRPGVPDHRPRRLDDARYRQVELWVSEIGSFRFFLFLGGGDKLFEPVGAAFPEGALCGQPCFDGGERLLLDGAGPHAALFARPDPAAVLEEVDVLHEGRQRHVERLRQLADAGGPLPSRPNTARRVGSASAWKMPLSCPDTVP